MATAVQQEVACPKCGGAMWDNRLSKKNPKQPDFKCRNRACDGVIWPPRNGTRQAAPPQNNAPQPFSQGGPLPYEVETGAPPAHYAPPQTAAVAATTATDPFLTLAQLYARCMDTALALANQKGIAALGGDTAGAVAAMCATLFIAAKDRGVR